VASRGELGEIPRGRRATDRPLDRRRTGPGVPTLVRRHQSRQIAVDRRVTRKCRAKSRFGRGKLPAEAVRVRVTAEDLARSDRFWPRACAASEYGWMNTVFVLTTSSLGLPFLFVFYRRQITTYSTRPCGKQSPPPRRRDTVKIISPRVVFSSRRDRRDVPARIASDSAEHVTIRAI